MQSTYKQLGKYIQPVDIRNKDLAFDRLLGVSIKKVLMPSIANTIGTNMKTYKVIKRNQFAYGPVTSRNGDKISIALLEEFDEAIISQAYVVFEVIDTEKLDPEYLMMWFRRPEFDRYARFMSHGSARETFDWEEMCEVTLPVPSIEKQRAIVKEYNTVVNRIKLNEQLNQKLEETAQALYKHWFVDFEFPNKDGKPYKSSGGKMVFNPDLEKEIPEGWKISKIEEHLNCNTSTFKDFSELQEVLYIETSNLTENKLSEYKTLKIGLDKVPCRARRKVKHDNILYSTVRPNLKHFGLIKNPKKNIVVSTGFAVFENKSEIFNSEFFYLNLIQDDLIKDLQAKAEMSVSTYPSIKPEDLLEIKVVLPKEKTTYTELLNGQLSTSYELINSKNNENVNIEKIRTLLLSKMTQVESTKEVVV